MCECRCGRCIIPTIIGIVFGIITGVLVNTGVITNFLPIAWIAFGIGLLAIVLLILIALFSEDEATECVCENGKCLAIGAIGTVFLAIVILAVSAITTGVAAAVLFGILGFFFIFTWVSLLQLLLCLVEAACFDREQMILTTQVFLRSFLLFNVVFPK